VQVIEDDHFSAISAMPYERITPPETSHWALVRSVTKFLGPDLRVALVATDGATARRLEARLSAGTTWVSHLLQQVVLRTLEQPATASLLTAARDAYADRAGHLLAALDAAGLPSRARTDGLNVWIELGHGDGARTATALARRGWQVRPGAPFAIGDGHRNAIRVTTSTLTPDQAAGFAGDLAGAITETNP
jgi:DNA-binding transcriptional MocR family regulator